MGTNSIIVNGIELRAGDHIHYRNYQGAASGPTDIDSEVIILKICHDDNINLLVPYSFGYRYDLQDSSIGSEKYQFGYWITTRGYLTRGFGNNGFMIRKIPPEEWELIR